MIHCYLEDYRLLIPLSGVVNCLLGIFVLTFYLNFFFLVRNVNHNPCTLVQLPFRPQMPMICK